MRFLPFLLALLFIFSACDKNSSDDTTLPTHSFSLEDSALKHYTVIKQGRNITIKEYPERVIIFDIFATWCPACNVIAPHLENLQQKYKDKLLVVGLSTEQNKPHSYYDAFSKKHHTTYPISNAEDNFMLINRIATDLRQPRQFPIPLIVMYDPKGRYFRHYVGAVPEEMIERDIQTALGKK